MVILEAAGSSRQNGNRGSRALAPERAWKHSSSLAKKCQNREVTRMALANGRFQARIILNYL
jgi:hypothetical protein